jgi:hypothetical protein
MTQIIRIFADEFLKQTIICVNPLNLRHLCAEQGSSGMEKQRQCMIFIPIFRYFKRKSYFCKNIYQDEKNNQNRKSACGYRSLQSGGQGR